MKHSSFNIIAGTLLAFLSVSATAKEDAPGVNLNALINSSYSFLKNREPEMTAGEYALYQKVVAMASSNPEFAMKLLEAMTMGSGPASAAFEFVVGNIYYTNHKMADAETHYKSAIKKYPDYIRAWSNLGILYYAQQQYTEAVPCLSKAVALGDHESSTLGLLATCHNKVGNIVAAEIAYREALSSDPSNEDWLNGLLELYIQAKSYVQAESLVKQLLRTNPKDAQHWVIYGNILVAQNRRMEGIAALETAGLLGGKDQAATMLLGDLYADQKLYKEASSLYLKLRTDSPDLGTTRLLRYSEVLLGDHQDDEAERLLLLLEKASDPKYRIAILQARASISTDRKDWGEARKRYEQLVAAAPLNGEGLMGLGEACRNQGDDLHAEFAYEQAAQLPDFAHQANVQLANLAVKAKKYNDAVDYIQKALAVQKSTALQEYLLKVQSFVPIETN